MRRAGGGRGGRGGAGRLRLTTATSAAAGPAGAGGWAGHARGTTGAGVRGQSAVTLRPRLESTDPVWRPERGEAQGTPGNVVLAPRFFRRELGPRELGLGPNRTQKTVSGAAGRCGSRPKLFPLFLSRRGYA